MGNFTYKTICKFKLGMGESIHQKTVLLYVIKVDTCVNLKRNHTKGRETSQVSVNQDLPTNAHLDTNRSLLCGHLYPTSANSFFLKALCQLPSAFKHIPGCLCQALVLMALPSLHPHERPADTPCQWMQQGTSLGPAGVNPGLGKPPYSPPFCLARDCEHCPSVL